MTATLDQDVRTTGRPVALPPYLLVSPTGRKLRDYQADSCEAVHAEWSHGISNTAAVLATGLGKNDMQAALLTAEARAGGRALALVDDKTLVGQIIARARMHDPSIPVGQVGDGRFQGNRPITVASRQTLGNARRRRQLLRPTLVIVDECHVSVSDSWLTILRWAGCLPPAGVTWADWATDGYRVDDETDRRAGPTRLLGLTATFIRGDNRNLGAVFRSIAIERDAAFGIAHGYLVPPVGRSVVGEHIDTEAAKTNSKGDYADDEMGEMVAQDVEHIVDAWFEHAVDDEHPEGRVTSAYTPSIKACAALAAAFRARGVATAEVYGTTPTVERGSAEAGTGIYGRLAAGVVRVLCSVGTVVKGWDCPPVSCILNARPTKLKGFYAQMVGRGLRVLDALLYPGHPVKRDCLVLDVVGAAAGKSLRILPDIHPDATYDDTAVDLRKCVACGGFLGRRTARLIAAGAARGIEPCGCPCPTCEAPGNPCECPPPERDPDGGRQRLKGPAVYADVDLLADPASWWHWRRTPGGVDYCAAGMRFAVLQDHGDGRYSAGHCEALPGGGPGVTLVEGVSLAEARAAADEWIGSGGEVHPADASWRHARARATTGQQRLAAQYGIEHPEGFTKGGLSDAIDEARAILRFDRRA